MLHEHLIQNVMTSALRLEVDLSLVVWSGLKLGSMKDFE